MKKEKGLTVGKLEFVFEKDFERDWASVLASYIYQGMKEEFQREERIDE